MTLSSSDPRLTKGKFRDTTISRGLIWRRSASANGTLHVGHADIRKLRPPRLTANPLSDPHAQLRLIPDRLRRRDLLRRRNLLRAQSN